MTTKRLISLLIFITTLNVSFAQGYISATIQHDGLTREYEIYIPAIYDGTTAVPLIFSFHGGSGTIANQIAIGDMSSMADTANFIAVYPQALPDPNDGGSTNWIHKDPTTVDDVYFVDALIDSIASNYMIDLERVYACGYSLGGEFTFELGCRLNNRIAAIGVVARTMQKYTYDNCSPLHPTGVLTILGTADAISDYNGVWYQGTQYYMSANEQNDYWVAHNNCEPTPTITPIADSDPNDGSTVERYTWANANGCVYVEELKVINGDHDWPGSFGNMDIDASNEIWNFVSNYNLNGRIGCGTNSVDQLSQVKVHIFPNPTTGQLIIESNYSNPTIFQVYNVLGEVVLSGHIEPGDNYINVASLKANIYSFIIGEETIKLVKID